jgi:CsbD-like
VRVTNCWGPLLNGRTCVKEVAGKVTGDAKLEAEGKADKAPGKVQYALGGLKDCSATIWMASRIASFGNAPQPVDRCLIQMFPNIPLLPSLPALTASDGLDPAPDRGGPLRAHSERSVPPPPEEAA